MPTIFGLQCKAKIGEFAKNGNLERCKLMWPICIAWGGQHIYDIAKLHNHPEICEWILTVDETIVTDIIKN